VSAPAKCYREVNGIYYHRDTHRPDCGDPGCRGCRPCPDTHCTARTGCTWHVGEEQTCGRCIAGVRRDIGWIRDLAALMPTAAAQDGLTSQAAILAGPAADPEAWTWRKVAARQGRAWHVSLTEADDEHHPAFVLGMWARMISEDYGHDMPANAPLTWSSAYLLRLLHRIAQDPGQDFAQMRRELRKCRQHLEAVIHNDDRPETGAPCPDCEDPRPRLVLFRGHYCQSEDCERFNHIDDAGDLWRCRNGHEWSARDYRLRVERWAEDVQTAP